jgi:hypothetical protein
MTGKIGRKKGETYPALHAGNGGKGSFVRFLCKLWAIFLSLYSVTSLMSKSQAFKDLLIVLEGIDIPELEVNPPVFGILKRSKRV